MAEQPRRPCVRLERAGHSARTVPAQCPYSARTVPVGFDHSARRFPFFRKGAGEPLNCEPAGAVIKPNSARAVPVQCPYSARTVPVVIFHSFARVAQDHQEVFLEI